MDINEPEPTRDEEEVAAEEEEVVPRHSSDMDLLMAGWIRISISLAEPPWPDEEVAVDVPEEEEKSREP